MIGLRYPLQLVNGRLVTTEDTSQLVADAIRSGVLTELGERVYRPYYGRDVQVLTTYSISQLAVRFRECVDLALQGYSEVTNYKVMLSQSSNGQLLVRVQYEIGGNTEEVTIGTNT